jgi:hypothetical protein
MNAVIPCVSLGAPFSDRTEVALEPHLEQLKPIVARQVGPPGAHDLPELNLQIVAARRGHRRGRR